MLRKIRIQNYKSILDDTIELGRLNVFIGENGCGKTNILEALAMTSEALCGDLSADGLFNRGVRLARPSLTMSAFSQGATPSAIEVSLDDMADPIRLVSERGAEFSASMGWRVDSVASALAQVERQVNLVLKSIAGDAEQTAMVEEIRSTLARRTKRAPADRYERDTAKLVVMAQELEAFAIYNATTPALRGLESASRKEPLGIHGEGLDTAIAGLDDEQRADLKRRAGCISWFKDLAIDEDDRLKLQGFKLGRSTSTLYFTDRFMAADNDVFSAENANEGILHVLFYLTLFLSKRSPQIFGIDNVESALNPQLCRELVVQLAELAVKNNKQALITTHNPAILDGLNLHDDEQRLFVVSRDAHGHTVTERVRVKPESKGSEPRRKLSELWMRGLIGGVPERF